MKKIFESKVFIIVGLIVLFGLATVFAETIIIDAGGITSSKGNTGMNLNMTILTDAGERWFMVYEDGLLVNTTKLIPGLADGLVSYYSFDAGVADDHGSNDGTNYGSTEVTGMVNNARSFDGTDDDVGLPAIWNSNDVGVTFSAWVKDTSTTVSSRRVFGYSNDGISTGVGMTGEDVFVFVTASNTPPVLHHSHARDNSWHHVVMTIEEDGFLKLYFDGNLKDSVVIGTITEGQVDKGRHIGADMTGGWPGQSFQGLIDEVGIWDRALSADEVARLYNSGNGLAYSEF